MPAHAIAIDRISKLHDLAVERLVAAHRQRTDEPLVLAIRYNLDDPQGDIYLLEVLEGFPGGDDDEVMVTTFEPSAILRTVGRLFLALASPAQVRSAIARGDAIIQSVRSGKVLYADGSAKARALKKLLTK